MIQRILHSKNFLAFVLACGTGMYLYFAYPFPSSNLFLRAIAFRAPQVYQAAFYAYTAMLFTTPFILFSVFLSGLYIFTLRPGLRSKLARLSFYPDPRLRQSLSLVIGEVHNPRKPVPSANPQWLTIPERGLYTGIAIFGAIGSGKTSCCMYPFAEQILAYKADNQNERIGGLVLEVKGDFCRKVKGILEKHGRGEDDIEVSLDSEYRYNPLGNLHPKTVEKWARQGKLPAYRVSRKWCFRSSELDAWLHSQVKSPCHLCRLREEKTDAA